MDRVAEGFIPHDGTIYGMFSAHAATNGARPFVLFADREVSWADALRTVDALAAALSAKGLGAGSRAGVLAPNSEWYVFLIIALARLGAVCVPINPELGDDEVAYIVGHARLEGLFAAPDQKARAGRIAVAAGAWCDTLPQGGVAAWLERAASGATGGRRPGAIGGPEDVWLILYTSGTTGFPKGVMHRQRTFTLLGECFGQRLGLGPDDRLFCVLSLFHANALFNSLAPTVAVGCTLALEERFSASVFWRRAAQVRATEANIIAAIGNILIRRPVGEFDASHCIARMYAVPVDEVMARIFRERFHVPQMVEGYGLSEAPGVISNTVGDVRIGSLGRPSRHAGLADRPYAEVRVVDDAGSDVPRGAVGEIIVRSAVTMVGYFDDQEKTDAAFLGEWFRTGDLGRCGEDGRYYFVSRKKDIIRRRGENISAAEVERTIRSHPAVIDVAVVGVASDLGEEELWAVVRPVAEGEIGATDIADWCRVRLAPFKVPRYVSFLDVLPYTPSHRVAKGKLRQDPVLLARATDIMAGT